jgi:hypothetical protein
MDVDRPCSSPPITLFIAKVLHAKQMADTHISMGSSALIVVVRSLVLLIPDQMLQVGLFIYEDNPVWVLSCQNNLLCQSCFVPRMDSFNAAHPGKVASCTP